VFLGAVDLPDVDSGKQGRPGRLGWVGAEDWIGGYLTSDHDHLALAVPAGVLHLVHPAPIWPPAFRVGRLAVACGV
jgi:hypothetical protein